MQGNYCLQELCDACVDYIRRPTSNNEAKVLHAYLVAEENGYGRKQLDSLCENVDKLLHSNLRKVQMLWA